MCRRLGWLILGTLSALLFLPARCAAAAPHARPRIGLALGGGGPRGFAHIGVLQWLEEHHVPVDAIAGTSMGGLVGAMYATGMTPRDMRTLVGRIDWDDVFRGAPPYDQLTFRRKEDRRGYPTAIELGLRGGLKMPGGLNPAHPIGLILDRLTLPYSTLDSFDDLPIPFRCVATDMLSGDAVVLDRGSLSLALRATMALPGVFTPVESAGRVLADGGLVNNLPADVAKDVMRADVVIAVDVGTPLGGRESLRSFAGMFNQAVRVMYLQNVRQNRKFADLLLTPEISREMGADYRAGDAIAELGYQSAARKAEELERYGVGEGEWQEYLARRRARQRGEGPPPEFVTVEGTAGKEGRALCDRLEKYVGRPVVAERLERELTAMTGSGRYESLGYEGTRINGKDGLLIRAQEKPYGPPFVNLGLDVSVAKSEEADFTVGSRVTALDLGGYGSELRTDVAVGSRPQLTTEYYRPLGRRGWFVAPRAFTGRSSDSLYRHRARVAEYRRDEEGIGLDIGRLLGRRSEVRLGYGVSHINAWARIGDPLLPPANGTIRAASLRWTFDGQDSALVPARGARVSAAAQWFFESPGASRGFPRVEASVSAFRPIARRWSLFALGGGGTTFGRDAPPVQQFTLGGPLRLGGYARGEFRGNNYFFCALGYLRHVSNLPPLLGGKLYAGNWIEAGSAFDRLGAAKLFGNVSGGVVAETKLGPVFLGGSLGEGGRRGLQFALGRLF